MLAISRQAEVLAVLRESLSPASRLLQKRRWAQDQRWSHLIRRNPPTILRPQQAAILGAQFQRSQRRALLLIDHH